MIEQFEIKNFRGFSEYKIDDVGQVNLLVGTNNCGKTSILEAIRLLKSEGNLYDLLSVLLRRGERIQKDTEENRRIYGDLCRLFYGFELNPTSYFSITGHINNQDEVISVSVHDIPIQPELFEKEPDFSAGYHLNVRWNETKDQDFPLSLDGGLSYDYIRRRSNIKPSTVKESKLEFVPTSSLSTQEIVALFEEIVLTPDEDLVLDALRIIEPDITRLASLGGNTRYYPLRPGNYDRGGLFVKTSKWEERVPIGSFGDGIWRLLGLILSLVAAKNGTLLIDEIDTGLHHTVMSKMWKLICITARKLNVQVFATTHSSDCWKTLADNAVEDEFADMPIRIHRIDKNKKKPETFTNREMHLAVDREIEVR
ncbi:MAG: AAA family ATPase [Candidatus Electrothrix sp. Rat3]|nr:AAA family ATPase [Candidatus Electrothrix rattekaaiensis]